LLKSKIKLPKQQKRRRIETDEIVVWLSQQMKITFEELLLIVKDKIAPLTDVEKKNPMKMLQQQLRNYLPEVVPPLKDIKKARMELNQRIIESLKVVHENGIVSLDPESVLKFILKKHATNDFKITFDHRKNEKRDEVLVALIPVVENRQHSPHLVYPLMLYCGKEEKVIEKNK